MAGRVGAAGGRAGAALEMAQRFHRAFPGLRRFQAAVVRGARRDGFVTTLAGRRRYLTDINNAQDARARRAAERQAINTVCQGSAADLVKRAMVALHARLRREFRQRFGVVADTIVRQLGRDTAQAVDACRKMNMFLDDFSCCKAACGESC